MSLRVCRSVTVILGFVLAALGLLLGFYVFPKVVDNKVDDSVKLSLGTDAYKRWEELPLPLHFKVYFFNVSNPNEVQSGAKPLVKELGPYVYNQYRKKYNITEDGDTLSYNQHQIFSFNVEASGSNTENDVVTIPHLPLMAIMTITDADPRGSIANNFLNIAIPKLFDNPTNLFLTTTVKEFLFDGIAIPCNNSKGVVNIVCKEIKKKAPVQLQELEDGSLKFSLLSFKNNSDDGRYTVNSGVNDVNSLAEIISWKNSSEVDSWQPNSTCNKIYGTDTTIFAPHKTQTSKVDVFQSDICRAVNLHYSKEIEYKDISGLRFTLENDTFASGASLPSHQCFCLNQTKGITGEDGCLLDGALELWNCQKVPLVLTLPHFYLTHQIYRDTVEGLNPDPSRHQTFVDLEPKSGTVLRGSKRVQFNIFYRKFESITLSKDLTDTLMPVVWIDEGIELDTKHTDLLYDSLFLPIMILEGVYWALIGLGLAIGLIGLVWCMIFAYKPKNLF